jgi:putative aldouronate transport system substrate-binding protein
MKKLVCLFFAVALAFPVFAGARRQSGAASDTGPVTVKYLIPGDPPISYDAAITAVNEKLVRDKNIRIGMTYIPWDVWQQRVNLMLSTGEEFDVFHIMQDQITMSAYQSMGGLTDITDLIDQHGPNIKKLITPDAFTAMRIGGRIYGIPAEWVELAVEGTTTIRKDVMDRLNLPMPRTNAELLTIQERAAANWDGNGKLYFPIFGSSGVNPLSSHLTILHREYSSFPFNVMDSIAYVDRNGNVSSWIESDEFKQDAQWMRSAYDKGLIHPDFLTMGFDQRINFTKNGNWVIGAGGDTGTVEGIRANNNPNFQPEDIIAFRLYPEKPVFAYQAVKNLNGISSTSKNPDAAIKFFDWLYTSQENYDLFMHGREGFEYTTERDGFIKIARDENNQALYEQADWMMGNLKYLKLGSDVMPFMIETQYTLNPNRQSFPGTDFFFNPSSVETEWINVQTELSTSIAPIYLGVQSYDMAFPAALRRMKAAGLDRVVAEYSRQMQAHLASK